MKKPKTLPNIVDTNFINKLEKLLNMKIQDVWSCSNDHKKVPDTTFVLNFSRYTNLYCIVINIVYILEECSGLLYIDLYDHHCKRLYIDKKSNQVETKGLSKELFSETFTIDDIPITILYDHIMKILIDDFNIVSLTNKQNVKVLLGKKIKNIKNIKNYELIFY